ncbi:MAG TPA: helix-turn-helix domain-containing protein [Blastocatellia bacterium]|nr:helix-turn-helix domain-containing protein [Blastocatellia bacterium]
METLSQYLERVMRQKGLSPKDVARRCGLTNSYIGRISKGQGKNLTVDTIVKLAQGLGVDAHEIFTAASGIPIKNTGVDPLLLLDMIQKVLSDPKGMELLSEWSGLPANKQKPLFDFIQFLNEQPEKKRKRK